MRKGLSGAALAIMLVSTAGIARADVDVAQIKIAYSDGYAGADGRFHDWEHRSDAESFRAKHADHYRPWRHDDPRHKDDR